MKALLSNVVFQCQSVCTTPINIIPYCSYIRGDSSNLAVILSPLLPGKPEYQKITKITKNKPTVNRISFCLCTILFRNQYHTGKGIKKFMQCNFNRLKGCTSTSNSIIQSVTKRIERVINKNVFEFYQLQYKQNLAFLLIARDVFNYLHSILQLLIAMELSLTYYHGRLHFTSVSLM